MNNQDILLRILKLINSRCIDPYTIIDKLKISKEELDTGLTILETHGYIEKVNYRNDCRTCPAYSKCDIKSPNLYRITEKGLRLIMRET
ncbi:MAG: hypothetical protein LZ172_06350 [Thaumarchaeota archaeon]|jgi:hypothetical protein|nr:hypothetical protein [Candidatus Geocrenenecus arthurdayi]MCL7389187.1 hypothetical protein [Candidatus Geocrenenecus arthurdayi]MCL7391441.1 hypothetical protein [Candidatus Geocrenenecus arthurdayi]MCL7395987.1 hypothetical protein [Candidatus Geocrenenecus arthurdayi]MCL7402105.1 hypothetical protein [Candidatus Geocrenenecus arthurdayi]